MIDRLLGRAMLDEEEPEALGLCRIALVTVMTASLLTHVGAVSDYFSSHSVLGGEVAREAFHSRWSIFFVVQEPWAVTRANGPYRVVFMPAAGYFSLCVEGPFGPRVVLPALPCPAPGSGRIEKAGDARYLVSDIYVNLL